jgi:hypothetical protein
MGKKAIVSFVQIERFAVMLLLVLTAGRNVCAEASFGGEVEVGLAAYPAFPYEGSRFDSPLNPDNNQRLEDLVPITDVLAKLWGESENTDFALWLAVKPYYLGQALLAAAAKDETQTSAVGEALPLLGAKVNYFEIYRANVGWYVSDHLTLRIGRQSMLTGYGYAWNPIDFINPLKDPYDPDLELMGVDAISALFYLGNVVAFRMDAVYRSEEIVEGLSFGDLQPGIEVTLALTGVDVKLKGFYDYDRDEGEDAYVPALGLGAKVDVLGAGVYCEGSLLKGSRNLFPESLVSLSRKTDWLLSGLLGVEYTFESEIRILLEYLYNGEGYDLAERKLYRDSLQSIGAPSSELLLMYRPGHFAEHYIYLNVAVPVYDWNTEFQLAAMYSPDSAMMSFLPMIVYDASGALSVELSYIGLLSLSNDSVNEAWLSPVKHVLRLAALYTF